MKKRIGWCKWLIPCFFVLLAVFFYTIPAGYSFSGLVCLAIAGVIGAYYGLWALRRRHKKIAKAMLYVLSLALCCGLIVVVLTGYLIYYTAQTAVPKEMDYVLVLGCRVREDGPSEALQDRIQAAYRYLKEYPQAVCIVSGGKGADEPISEAQCIFEHLVDLGIEPERIWLEEQATSTMENIQYTLELLEEKTGKRPDSLGVISSDYHLYRAKLYAKHCGIEVKAVAAKTNSLPLRINNYLREIAGVWHYIILGG